MIFTYDEAGGFYDHVSPPAYAESGWHSADRSDARRRLRFDRTTGRSNLRFHLDRLSCAPDRDLAFRKKNYVSHTVMITRLMLTLIEKRFGVAALTKRDAAQADMSTDFFDFVNAPWATPPTPPAQSRPGSVLWPPDSLMGTMLASCAGMPSLPDSR